MNKKIKFGELFLPLPKSKRMAKDACNSGIFPFFICSEVVKSSNYSDYKEEALILSTGGKANIHYCNSEFSASADTWVIKINSDQLDTKYAFYFLENKKKIIEEIGFQGSGLKHLNKDFIRDIAIPLPPLPQQKKIVEILSGIDNYLQKLYLQKIKLEITKNALQQELLTVKIGKFKSSSYGSIPSHWSELSLMEVVGKSNLQTGPFGSQLHAHEYRKYGIPVIMPQDMKECKVVIDKIARIPEERTIPLKKHKVKIGDLLFSRRGDIGRHVLITKKEEDWICGTGCLRIRPNENIDASFLSALLQSKFALEWLNLNAVGQTMLNLNTSILGQLPVLVPPIEEQKKISNIFNVVTRRLKSISNQILKIQNLKMGISADLLSGRKRVIV